MSVLANDPLKRFSGLLARARRTSLKEPTAMSLATTDGQGRVSVRTVLLKGVDAQGFTFYTNFQSRKGRQISSNDRVALCFYWDPLREQVMVEGKAKPVASAEADRYWASRPRESQLAAWASRQSRFLRDREELLSRMAHFTAKFEGKPVPRPAHWSGFCIVPDRIEFWKAKPFRLHDRIVYERRGRFGWKQYRVYP